MKKTTEMGRENCPARPIRVSFAPLSRCALAFVSGFQEYDCDGFVTGCDGKCDGSSFRKYLINNNCDGVTAQNPGGSVAANLFFRIKWRKPAFLQKPGIAPFFGSECSNLLPVRTFRLKPGEIGARNLSNFWRISPGVYTPGGVWGGGQMEGWE
jgi:hypothetical protein